MGHHHYHASVLAAGMPMASGVFAREKEARGWALSCFEKFQPHRRKRLARRLARQRYAIAPPAYVIVIEECQDDGCLRSSRSSNGQRR